MSLCEAVRLNEIDELERLISDGGDLFEISANKPSFKNNTLHVAVSRLTCNPDIVKILLRRANELGREYLENYINSQNSDAESPLFICCHYGSDFSGHEEVIQLLMSNGVDLNKQNDSGDTPLHRVLYQDESNSICELLINSGARIDIPNSEGETARDMVGVPKHILKLMDEVERRNELETSQRIKKTKLSVLTGHRERMGRARLKKDRSKSKKRRSKHKSKHSKRRRKRSKK